MRPDGRAPDQLRPVEFIRGFTDQAAGSVLVRAGRTHVLCTASVLDEVPEWRSASGKGWLTAEYDMLPGSTGRRRGRNRGKIDGRTQEIQRLVGRCLRMALDLGTIGPRTIYLDCDVLQADGGTRTAAITGAYVALCEALSHGGREGWWLPDLRPTAAVAAVSVGVIDGQARLDLDYQEDSRAEVDCNLAMTSAGEWIEVQATGERGTIADATLIDMLSMGRRGIERLFALQRQALGDGAA